MKMRIGVFRRLFQRRWMYCGRSLNSWNHAYLWIIVERVFKTSVPFTGIQVIIRVNTSFKAALLKDVRIVLDTVVLKKHATGNIQMEQGLWQIQGGQIRFAENNYNREVDEKKNLPLFLH